MRLVYRVLVMLASSVILLGCTPGSILLKLESQPNTLSSAGNEIVLTRLKGATLFHPRVVAIDGTALNNTSAAIVFDPMRSGLEGPHFGLSHPDTVFFQMADSLVRRSIWTLAPGDSVEFYMTFSTAGGVTDDEYWQVLRAYSIRFYPCCVASTGGEVRFVPEFVQLGVQR